MQRSRREKCKDNFVRMVNAAPFPIIPLAFDYTLDDLVRFCTAPTFSVFGVDSTFNVSNFDLTVTTYHYLLLENQQNPSGKPPTMIDSKFIHVRKDFSIYYFLLLH